LWLPVLVYCAASLLHFGHNAAYLHEYPNLPPWLTSTGVYAAWCAITAIGALGYWLYRRISRAAGLLVITVYAVLGFGGLDHYVVAPISAHSIMMNLTIVVEIAAAAVLLLCVARSILLMPRVSA
jgi:hypothetical protein